MAANKAVPKQPESDLIKRTKDWPGPGAYSPRTNMAQTADKAIKYGGSVQLQPGLGTLETIRSSNTLDDSVRDFRRGSSGVELHVAKTIGKNPPPRLKVDRMKVSPSIPSNSVAPPEDKTMMTTTYQSDPYDTHRTGGFMKGPRQSEYLALMEKTTNPNVGPGSYDPVLKPKLNSTINTDWARGSERFRSVSMKGSVGSPQGAAQPGQPGQGHGQHHPHQPQS